MDKDYICGCGKAYGSYPAFSTHRKTKHNNNTVPGTVLPAQQKAKRGRPSCDFKKLPEIQLARKQYYQGLNIIQYGLLDLEEKNKGKILSEPHENNELSLDDIDSESDSEPDQQRIQAISTFVKLVTNHMQVESSEILYTFFKSMVQFGIRNSLLTSIQLYNVYCINNIENLSRCNLGLNFYVDVCLLLSKWLCVMGYSKEILRPKMSANGNGNGCALAANKIIRKKTSQGVMG